MVTHNSGVLVQEHASFKTVESLQAGSGEQGFRSLDEVLTP